MNGAQVGAPGRWSTPLPDGRIQCDLCPRRCRLRPGQRGYCFIRRGTDGGIELTTWGRSSGFAVDPIEKKPLFHFHPGTAVFSFGTAGCNLGCRFCQNWEISTSREWDRLAAAATPDAIARWCVDNGVPQVAFTYNDPVVFAEYAIDTARACRSEGIRSVAVTAGWIGSGAREEFFDVMDATNIDLKGFNEEFYRRITGASLTDVLETIAWVARRGRTWMELTTLLIPGLNDSDDEIRREAEWIRSELGPEVPLHFTAFHPAHRMTGISPTPVSTLIRARALALEEGLHHVYTGNVVDPEGSVTRCAGCGEALIERERYVVSAYRLTTSGACPCCGTPLPGRFGVGAGLAYTDTPFRMAPGVRFSL